MSGARTSMCVHSPGDRRATGGPLDSPLVLAPVAAADWLRRRWLHLLGRFARPIVRRRELRVAVMFSAIVAVALVGALVLPFWLLLVGPLVWGVPHLVADLRYLVLRTGYALRPSLWLVAGGPLLWLAIGGGLEWGFIGAGATALLARAALLPRIAAALFLGACAALVPMFGETSEVVFAHGHNLLAVAVWLLWRRRIGRAHWVPLVLLAAAIVLLLAGPALTLAASSGGLDRFGAGMGPAYQTARLGPDVGRELGLRLVLLFCFTQSVHYALWLHLVPDEDRPRATPPTFRTSLVDLRADLGDAGLLVAALLTVGIAVWAALDLMQANHGYFRMARFHGHLEIMAGTLLLLERRH